MGLDQLQVKAITNEEFTWNRKKPKNFRFKGDMMDPMRHLSYERPAAVDEATKNKDY